MIHMKFILQAILMSFLICAILPIADVYRVNAATITVPDNYLNIQEAINHASPGDTIFVKAGTYNESVVVNKTLSLVGENMATTILNGTSSVPMMIVEANNVNVSGFAFRGWSSPNIVVNSTTGVNIAENSIIFNAVGIDVENSSSATMENNVINGSGLDNIGILLVDTSECRIINNTITNAVYWGIRFWYSDNNTVNFNLIEENDEGIDFYGSSQNTVSENTISKSHGAGIYFESGSDNRVFENNFINNWTPVQFFGSTANVWDNGSRGNYWSDYLLKYPSASQIGDIWNESYLIDPKNIDHYPLVDPVTIPEFTTFIALSLFMISMLAAVILCRKEKRKLRRIPSFTH
jgi:parallel beta-helix repeat protein